MCLRDQYEAAISASQFTFPDNTIRQFINDPNKTTAAYFMTALYEHRSKGSLLNGLVATNDSIFARSAHSASAFLLGLSLRKIVEARFDHFRFEINDPDLFAYLWMLCSLYHDIYSDLERNTPVEKYQSLDDFQYSIYDRTKIPFDLRKGIHFKKTTYSQSTVNFYYGYRCGQGKPDHGILSGFTFYDKMINNYVLFQRFVQEDNSPEPIEINGQQVTFTEVSPDKRCFTTKVNGYSLLWKCELLPVYAYAADAIIAHNIWHDENNLFPKELRVEDHGEGETKLNRRYNPLAFFLGLIDTIEPLKYFTNIREKTVLDNITITYDQDKSQIVISQSGLSLFNLEKWHKDKMDELKLWLFAESEYCAENDTIVITLTDRP